MFSKLIDSFCLCQNPKETKQTMIKIILPDTKTSSELPKKSFLKTKLSENTKLTSSKNHTGISIVPIHLFVNNYDNELNFPHTPQSHNQHLSFSRLPDEVIKKKIQMFGTFAERKKKIDENALFQKFQSKVDTIIDHCLKQKTISESEDSECFEKEK